MRGRTLKSRSARRRTVSARARCAHARMVTSRADPGVIVGLRPRLCSSRNALAPRGPIRPLNRKYDQGVNHITAHSCNSGYRREVGVLSEPSGTRRRASCPAQIACWCSRPTRRRLRLVSLTPCHRPRCRRPTARSASDESSSRIRDHEWQSYIRERRRLYNAQRRPGDAPLHDTGDEAPHDLTGIALSGGGIRSATFALGVLQRARPSRPSATLRLPLDRFGRRATSAPR